MIMPTIEETQTKIKHATLWTTTNGTRTFPDPLNHDWGMTIEDGTDLLWQLYLCSTRSCATRRNHFEILWPHHCRTSRHRKTKELMLREYWWPKMKKDIENYIRACKTCQQTKSSTQAKAAPLHPNAIPSQPWTHISIDMVTGLPMCKGYDCYL